MADRWLSCTLGDVIELKRGYDLPDADRRQGSVPIVSSSGVSGRHDKAKVRAPGVVTGRYGTIGQVFFVNEDFWPLNTTLYVRDFKGNDARFISYFLRSLDFQSFNDKSSVPGVNRNDLHRYEVIVPEPEGQRAIAGVLGVLDDKIDQNRRTAQALERLTRAIFRSWFVDFEPVKAKAAGENAFPSMPQGVFDALPARFVGSDIGPVPEGWSAASVYEFADVIYGAPFSSKLFNDRGIGLPLIRIRDLQTHAPTIFTPQQHPKGTLIQPTDIVVGMDGEFRLHYWTGTSAWLNQRVCAFTPKSGVPRMFLGESLRLPLAHFERAKTGTTVIHLGKADIDTFRLVRPDPKILTAFGDLTDSLLKLFVHAAQESRSLARMRDYLLPKLLSGEVQVTPHTEKGEADV